MTCDKELYLSGGTAEWDAPYEVTVECNGPRPCGFYTMLASNASFGITTDEMAALMAAHRKGLPPPDQWRD